MKRKGRKGKERGKPLGTIDYHTHPMGHGQRGFTEEVLRRFIDRAEARGITHLGFADHDWYREDVNPRLVDTLQQAYPGISLRCGLEFDYRLEREKEIAETIARLGLDFTIGSVHHVGDWNFDNPDHIAEYDRWEPEELFATYFSLVRSAAESNLFDIIGHLDLIKVFYLQLPVDADFLLEAAGPALEAIRSNKLIVEVNTNGLNKPAAEIYPAEAILRECSRRGIGLTLGSDAHRPERVGEYASRALQLLRDLGYRELAALSRHELEYVPI